ncbi:MAG: ATP-binding protein [Oscillospiraceae bacterium]|jgi:predicted AAA+ superfamily ATPase|nr:ATP-binding protein [Oscillospiraceae bacterium]
MYRDKIKELIDWKLGEYRKPLIVLGARQVGKTWLIQEFGKQKYKQTVYINFEKAKVMRDIFLPDLDTKRLITNFELFAGFKITPEDTLIVLDEIQAAPQGITSLKYFNEDSPEYQIIAAGSLLGINIHPNESFPVGKVDFLELRPMSFYEFLLAMNENGLARILDEKLYDSLPVFAEKFKEILKYYLYIGGMPEVVLHFSQFRDFNKARQIQKKVLKTYQSDFSKHAPKDIVPRINMVWKSIPSQLAKENKKFVYGVVKEGGRAKEFELAIQWLLDCGLLHRCFRISKPGMPLSAYQDLSAFKLYHNDVGLLAAMAKLPLKTILDGSAIFEEFKGALTENYVMQQLLLKDDNDIYYWTNGNSTAEVDFVIQNDEEIIPVEVKSGANLKSASFKFFCDKYSPQKAIRTSLADYKEEDRMTNIPLYAINTIG